eukprot:gene12813-14126_t
MKQALRRAASWNDTVSITAFRDSKLAIVPVDFCLRDWGGHTVNRSLTVRGIGARPVIDCKNEDGTGLFFVTGTTKRLVHFTIENLDIRNIMVSAVGVADGVFTAKNCAFFKATAFALQNSGILFASKSTLDVENCTFEKYTTAISLSSESLSINIKNSVFFGDEKFKTNVAVSVPNSQSPFPKVKQELNISIVRSRFLWNRFSVALHELARNSSILIRDTRFEENSARGLHGLLDKGSAIFVSHAVLADEHVHMLIKNSTMKNNEANIGGAVHVIIFKSDPSFDDSKNLIRLRFRGVDFINNTAQQVAGSVFASIDITNNKITFQSCKFNNNSVTATDKVGRLSSLFFPALTGTGGAVYITIGEIVVDECRFSDNTATIFGGGLAAATKVSLSVRNSVFSGSVSKNNAKVSGRLLYLGGQASFDNVTINSRDFSEGVADVWYQSANKYNDLAVKNLRFNCMPGGRVESVKIKSYMNEANYYILEYHCKRCESGTYSLDAGKEMLQSSKAINTTIPVCMPCPYGATCINKIRAKPNFWGFEQNGRLRFAMCPRGYCSRGGNDQAAAATTMLNSCSTGRKGKLCGRCDGDSSENLFDTNCSPDAACNDWWIHIAVFLVAVGYVCFFLYLNDILRVVLSLIWPSRKHVQSSGLTALLIAQQPKNDDKTTMNSDGASKISDHRNLIASLTKIIFYFYQLQFILNMEGVAMLDTVANTIKQAFIDALSIQPTNHLTRGCPFKGLTPVTKTLYKTLFNVYIYVIIVVLYALVGIMGKMRSERLGKSSQSFVARLCQGSVTLILLNYAHMGNVSLTMLHCVDVIGGPVLFIDGEVTCFQPWQYAVMAYVILFIAPVTVVLLFGVPYVKNKKMPIKVFMISLVFPPAMIAFLVRPGQHCHDEKGGKSNVTEIIDDVDDNRSVSSNSYMRQVSSASTPRSPAANSTTENANNFDINHIYYDDETPRLTASTGTGGSETEINSIGYLNSHSTTRSQDSSEHEAVLNVLAKPFLKDNAGPVYWEGVLLLRRLSIIVLSVMLENRVVFLYVSLLLIIVTLVHHHWKQPFQHTVANVAETAFLILLCALCAINLFNAHYIMDDQQLNEAAFPIAHIFDWIALIISIGVPVIVLLAIVAGIVLKIALAVIHASKRGA